MMPIRIQRSRTKGWRQPPNTVYVGRPTFFGNPFTPEYYWAAGYSGDFETAVKHCIQAYREWLTGERFTHHWRTPAHFEEWLAGTRAGRLERLPELRGKNLTCWCAPGPCHADVLLELANAP